jgi:hypothetical protein
MEHWLIGTGRRSTERFVFYSSTVGIDLFNTNPNITYNNKTLNKRNKLLKKTSFQTVDL